MATLRPITVQNFVATLNGANGFSETVTFEKCSNLKLARSSSEYNDGQTGQKMATFGFSDRSNLGLSKAYDPVADANLEKWLIDAITNPKVDSEFTITIQPVNSDLAGTPIAGASPRTFTGCQVVSFKLPDVDRGSAGVARLEIDIYYVATSR
jgi:hypothetical protein